ncbi:MAG TPA: hypothetical protein VE861_05390 [Gemmatimonadaceae bacterium]|nr:hypothetical protein [Gemmatimonadaceae bacterium]
MERTLPAARDQFVKAIARDTHAVEQPRLVAVLDAMIAWSNKHPTLLKFREEEDTPGTIAFERVGTKMVVWAASPRRQDVPRLELVPKAAKAISPEHREKLVNTLNAHMREPLQPDEKLRIAFSALKNTTAMAAVQTAVEELIATT